MLTESGCMLAYPFSKHRCHLLPRGLAFVTGTWREHWVVAPLLLAALGWLAWRDAGSAAGGVHLAAHLGR